MGLAGTPEPEPTFGCEVVKGPSQARRGPDRIDQAGEELAAAHAKIARAGGVVVDTVVMHVEALNIPAGYREPEVDQPGFDVAYVIFRTDPEPPLAEPK